MDPFFSIGTRVLYEERVSEGLRGRRRSADSDRPWRLILSTALTLLGVHRG